MQFKSDSEPEVTSIAASSPTRSPRRGGLYYFVQSPSRDSQSIQSTPILTPVASPFHTSQGRHSRESSASRFSGNLIKPGGGSRKVSPHDHRHGKGAGGHNAKGWPECNVILEEGNYDDPEAQKGFSRRCYLMLFLLCFSVLFAVFCLILWGASRPYRPEIAMKSIAFSNFYVAEGADPSGVPTKMASLNCTIKMRIYNPATFFGIHVTSTPVDLMFYDLTIATGQLREYYQPRKSHRTVSVVVEGEKVPLYGAGGSLSSSIPLKLVFAVRSRANVLGKLVKPKFKRHVHCSLQLDPSKMRPVRSLQRECQYE